MTIDSDRTGERRETWRGLVIGVMAGMLSGLFGVGGGLIIVPALLAITRMERKLAHGTSLAATVPIASASLATYAFNGDVDWAIAGWLAAGAVAGAIAGTHLLQVIPKTPLTIIFIVTVIATALRLVLSDETLGRGDLTLWGGVGLVVIGFVAGTLSGLLGIGGGVVMVPAMIVLYSMVPVVAKGTSVAVIVPSSLMGTWRNRSKRNADIRLAAAIGAAGVVSAVIGSTIAGQISDTASNVTFALLLAIVALLQIQSLRTPVRSAPHPAPEAD
ncbi:MAG: sulfite exporter TauE/SafE family protein [Ilumatobacter sp.]|uniref:sulfite exporter TauE/SafE family protein n=1 Tax=Ilumatobacter sp. TaxID=1967498 RepID=UPI003918EBEB